MSVTLIIGGTGSGKSEFAEGILGGNDARRAYIATAVATDGEMAEKIRLHRQRRDSSWSTVEEPLDLVAAIQKCAGRDMILVECLPTWLTNHLMAGSDIETEFTMLLEALDDRREKTVVVSGEAGSSVIPDNELARRYVNLLGRINRQVASISDNVILVVAGLPQVLKGRIPQ